MEPLKLNKYYVTFGVQYHHETHPTDPSITPDGWAVIEAHSEESARQIANAVFDGEWSMIYTEENFAPEYYPMGAIYKVYQRVVSEWDRNRKEARHLRPGDVVSHTSLKKGLWTVESNDKYQTTSGETRHNIEFKSVDGQTKSLAFIPTSTVRVHSTLI